MIDLESGGEVFVLRTEAGKCRSEAAFPDALGAAY